MALSANLKAVDEAFCDKDSLLHLLEEVLAAVRPGEVSQLPDQWRRNALDVLWDLRGSVAPVLDPDLVQRREEWFEVAEKAHAELMKALVEAGVEKSRAWELLNEYERSLALEYDVGHESIYRQGLRDGLAVAGLVGLLTHKK